MPALSDTKYSGLPSCLIMMAFMLCLGTSASAQETPQADTATPGYSPVHELKYKPGFRHFDYVNPQAAKGGVLKIAAQGGFNSLNTLHWPGRTPGDGRQQFNMRYLILDSLIEASADEPAGYYGLLAQSITAAEDFSFVRFRIRKEARWHDGKPVLASDVVFTFATLLEQGAPYYRQILRDIQVVAEDDRTVLFKAAHPGDRNFVATIGTIPIHPKHFWEKNDVGKSSTIIPLGSGPYRVKSVSSGKNLVLERVKDYWAAQHPLNVGRYNFDTIKVVWFRDSGVALEAFKAGEFDMRIEGDAVRWSTGYTGSALSNGKIVKRVMELKTPGQIMALVFNLRRKPFDDVRVRQAIALAYDFNWTNRNLFHNLYEPVTSFFGTTDLAARGKAGRDERAILEPFVKELPTGLMGDVALKPRGEERGALKKADRLLREAGYVIKDGLRTHKDTGKQLTLRIVHRNPRLVRVLAHLAGRLHRLGIVLDYRVTEPALATRQILGHEFDMATLWQWSPSLLPGKGERLLWGSTLADKKHTYALAGAKDPALDAAIEVMNGARNLSRLQAGSRAFDRVLGWRHYVVPLYRSNTILLAHKGRLKGPDMSGMMKPRFIDLWWWSKLQKSAMQLNSQ